MLGKEMAMNQTNYGLRAKRGVGDYYIFFSTAERIGYLRQQAYGTIFDTIPTKTFRDTMTVQPPQTVLRKFDGTVRPIMTRVLGNESESRTLAALRDTLLPKLLSGEVRVGDLDHEGAK
jgi:type I restriction enzyme, S subunit